MMTLLKCVGTLAFLVTLPAWYLPYMAWDMLSTIAKDAHEFLWGIK